MNLKLIRKEFKDDGIFGVLITETGTVLAQTLEHSYDGLPKLEPGNYTCVRGQHELHSGPIETFEITGVDGHKGILFHPGNTEADSEGCVLLGRSRQGDTIIHSREDFNAFLALQQNVRSFELVVLDAPGA